MILNPYLLGRNSDSGIDQLKGRRTGFEWNEYRMLSQVRGLLITACGPVEPEIPNDDQSSVPTMTMPSGSRSRMKGACGCCVGLAHAPGRQHQRHHQQEPPGELVVLLARLYWENFHPG